MDYQTEDGVITFEQIWRVVKKSLARAAIYVVVCAILSFAVMFTVRTVTLVNTYSAKITFSLSDETIKSTLDGYRATATNKAISEVFGSSDDATEIYEEVLKTLTITAYIPEENEDDTSYVATTFTVSFEEVGISGVSAAQQTSLIENICSELIEYYSEINSTDSLSETLAWGYTVNYNIEYMDILSELSTRLSTLKTTMSSNISANVAVNSKFATYKSTAADSNRRTAYEILAQIDNIEYTVSNLKDNVYNGGITNTDATLNGDAYCIAKLVSLQNEYDELETVAAAYETQLANLGSVIQGSTSSSSSSSTGSTIISVDISEYTNLSLKLIEVQTDMASIAKQKTEIETLQKNIATNSANNAANMAITESTIDDIIEAVTSLIEEYNDLVAEFEEQVMPSTYASVSKSAAAYGESVITIALLIIIVIAAVVIAYAVAFGQTWSAMRKAGTLGEKKPLKKEFKA